MRTPAGSLYDVERRRNEDVSAEREDHRRGVKRPDAAEIEPRQIEVQHRPGELERGPQPHQKAGDAPEHRKSRRKLDRPQMVVRLPADLLKRHFGRPIVIAIEYREHGRATGGRRQIGVEGKGCVLGLGGTDDAKERR
jgi:hypothetical protein